MASWFTGRVPIRRLGDQLYGAIVAQARQPLFYRGFAVPDTLEGRFEMVVLHMFVLLKRLDGESEQGRDRGRAGIIAQAVVDALFRQLDDDMRELGIGDLTVPKKMRLAAAAFHDRLRAYREALGSNDSGTLDNLLRRHVYQDCDADAAVPSRLADYLRLALDLAGEQEFATIETGRLDFPDPAGPARRGTAEEAGAQGSGRRGERPSDA